MKKFMSKCYNCGEEVRKASCVKDGVDLDCLKCERCGEEYFTSSELVKYDLIKGNRKFIRKFGILGDSTILRFPAQVLQHYKIKPGDYGVFENKPEGILIKPVHAKEVKP